MPKKTNKSKIVLVSNTTWYLYNFRVKLLFLIKSNNYDLFLICPKDEYTEKLEKLGFKIYNWNHTQYHKGTVVEIYEESVKYKHDSIGGHFIVLKKHVEKFCESCECDPCDCDWGN